MTAFYGDLIVPDVDPVLAAAEYRSADLAAGLAMLAPIAQEIGLADVWVSAEPIGLTTSFYPGGPPRMGQPGGVFGASLAWAPLAGIGFHREDNYVTELPVIEPSMSLIQQAILRKNESRLREQASIRGPEVLVVRLLTKAAARRLPFPVTAALGCESSWIHDFRAAYLRRLAYGLGFEASLRAGSLKPYETLYPVLIGGTAAELRNALSPAEAALSFSVLLNVLGVLDAVSAYERDNEGPAPVLSGRAVDAGAKRALLTEQLARAAEARKLSLHDEGQLVVDALVVESRRLSDESPWWSGSPPDWRNARVPDPGRLYSHE